MKTYDFDQENLDKDNNINNELDKNRKYSKSILWAGVILLLLMIGGGVLFYYLQERNTKKAIQLGELTRQNIQDSIKIQQQNQNRNLPPGYNGQFPFR